MSSLGEERVAAHKRRVEELRRARQAFHLNKVQEEKEILAEGSRLRSGSTISALSSRFVDGRPRSASILSRHLSHQSDDGPGRSNSDAVSAAQAAKVASLQAEVAVLKQQVKNLQSEKDLALEVQQDSAAKLEEAEAENDRQAAIIATIQEQFSEKLHGQISEETLNDFQKHVQEFHASNNNQSDVIKQELSATKEELSKIKKEYDIRLAEWTGVAEALMGSSKGASIINGEADLKIILEEHQLYKQENEELQGMLQDSLEQVETFRGKVTAYKDAQEFLEASLAELEDENQRLQEQVSATHVSERTMNTRDTHIRELQTEVEEMTTKAEANEAAVSRLQQDLGASRQANEELQQQLSEALSTRQIVDKKVDEFKIKLDKQTSMISELHHTISQMEVQAREWQRERDDAIQAQTTLKAEVEEKTRHAHQAAVSEVQAALTSAETQEREVKKLKLELRDAQDNAEKMQFQLESVISSVRKDLVETQGDSKAAALAGLSLTELVEQLKKEKTRCIEECTRIKKELEETEGKLNEREELLTRVMDHLQSMGAETDTTSDNNNALENISLQLKRFKDERDHLLEFTTQLEDEIDSFQTKYHALELERSKLLADNANLESLLSKLQDEFDMVSQKLDERNDMLSKAMKYIQGLEARDEDDGTDMSQMEQSPKKSISLDDMEALFQKLEELRQVHEGLQKRTEDSELALMKANNEIAKSNQALQDEIDTREAQYKMLEEAQLRVTCLQDQIDALEQSQSQLQSELEASKAHATELDNLLKDKEAELAQIRSELESVDANMRAAAEAGLSLTQMLAKLREDHAAKVAELEEELTALKAKVAEYERILRGVKDMLEQENESDEHPHEQNDEESMKGLIARLKKRLEMSDASEKELERLLQEMEREIDEQKKIVSQQQAELEKNRLRQSELEEALNNLQQQYDSLLQQYRKLQELLNTFSKDSQLEQEQIQESAMPTTDGLSQQLARLLEELESRLEEINHLRSMQNDLTIHIAKLEEEKSQDKRTISDLNDELMSSKHMQEELEKKLAAALAKIELLEKEIARLKSQIEKLLALTKTQKFALQQQTEIVEKLKKHITERNKDIVKDNVSTNELRIVDHIVDEDMLRSLRAQLALKDMEIEELKDQLRRERELIRFRLLSRWRNDTKECQGCGIDFSIRVRRHHCRLCGKVMCHACCSDRVQTSSNRRAVRACRDCYDLIMDIQLEEQTATQDAREAYEYARRTEDTESLDIIKISKQHTNDPVGADFHYFYFDYELKVTVAKVMDSTPASDAGLRPGQMIMAINDVEVADMNDVDFESILRCRKEIILEAVRISAIERTRAMSMAVKSQSDSPYKFVRDNSKTSNPRPIHGELITDQGGETHTTASDTTTPKDSSDKVNAVAAQESVSSGRECAIADQNMTNSFATKKDEQHDHEVSKKQFSPQTGKVGQNEQPVEVQSHWNPFFKEAQESVIETPPSTNRDSNSSKQFKNRTQRKVSESFWDD